MSRQGSVSVAKSATGEKAFNRLVADVQEGRMSLNEFGSALLERPQYAKLIVHHFDLLARRFCDYRDLKRKEDHNPEGMTLAHLLASVSREYAEEFGDHVEILGLKNFKKVTVRHSIIERHQSTPLRSES